MRQAQLIAAVRSLRELVPGTVTLQLPLDKACAVADALPSYCTFSAEKLRALLTTIADLAPTTSSVTLGWNDAHEIELVVVLQLDDPDWVLFLRALGDSGATYSIGKIAHAIWWPCLAIDLDEVLF